MDEAEEAVGGKARVGLSQAITRTLEELAPVLDSHKGGGFVIGGIAVIARGVPRVTRDIDVAFSGANITLHALAAELAAAGIVARIEDALAFAAESQVLLLRHAETGVDVDVSMAWMPFELEAMAAAGAGQGGRCRSPNRRTLSSTRRSHGDHRISRTSNACSSFMARG